MYFQKFKKPTFFIPLFFVLILTSCAKKGSVLAGDWIYEDKGLTKKTAFYVARGEWVNYKNCHQKACEVRFREKMTGYFPAAALYPEILETVTFMKPSSLMEQPDLGAKNLGNIEPGTRAFLLREEKVWSGIDLGEKRGFVLMENLYRGMIPVHLHLETPKLLIQLTGAWYVPFLSGERKFSLEKAFDGQEKSFAIARKEEKISLMIRSQKNSNMEGFKLIYRPEKHISYKNLTLPSKMIIFYPEAKTLTLNQDFSYSFYGNRLEFAFSSDEKNMTYLNGFSIVPLEESRQEVAP